MKGHKKQIMREYKFDNLKFIMIFCVIFGHCLELINGNISKNIYIFIYTFHMPIFAFISGYFAKYNPKRIIKFTYMYLIWQTIYYLLDKFILNINTNIQYITPNWLMWYMMAIIAWTMLIKIFDTNSKTIAVLLLLFTFILSIIAGFVDSIGYCLSISRIITFFPYFLLGYYTKNLGLNLLDMKDRNKIKITFFIAILSITLIYFFSIKDTIEFKWLYGSYSYNKGNYNCIFKIMWILLSLCELAIFTNITSDKKINLISKIGANTLIIYLAHGLIIKILRYKIPIFCYGECTNIILALLITIIIVILFGICVPELLMQLRTRIKSMRSR